MRILIGALGFEHLQDLGLAPAVLDYLREFQWPPGVDLVDLSHAQLAGIQRLQERSYDRAILLGTVARGGRPGEIRAYRLDGGAGEVDLSKTLAESQMGAVSLDHLLALGSHFSALPAETTVLEVEPAGTEWDRELTPQARAAARELIERIVEQVRQWTESS